MTTQIPLLSRPLFKCQVIMVGVTIVGTDTDILALLIHKCTNQEIHYHIPGTELNQNVTYSIKNTRDNMSYTVKKYILFSTCC